MITELFQMTTIFLERETDRQTHRVGDRGVQRKTDIV